MSAAWIFALDFYTVKRGMALLAHHAVHRFFFFKMAAAATTRKPAEKKGRQDQEHTYGFVKKDWFNNIL